MFQPFTILSFSIGSDDRLIKTICIFIPRTTGQTVPFFYLPGSGVGKYQAKRASVNEEVKRMDLLFPPKELMTLLGLIEIQELTKPRTGGVWVYSSLLMVSAISVANDSG